MILTHLGKTDYAWAETTKALLIEAVDKCSDIESAKADKRKYMDVVNENGNKRVDRTTWNGGHVKGVKHGLCFYEICCDCKNQCGHAQRETKSWFVYNKGKLVWQEHSIVAVPKFATAEPKPKPTAAEPELTTAEPEPATDEYKHKTTIVVFGDKDAGTPATKAHVNMILTHLGKTDYDFSD